MKWQSECQDGDVDTETEFFPLLLEPVCVYWRKVPICTFQFYFGKLATFVSSEQMQLCFKFPKTKSRKWHCTYPSFKISCSKVVSNISGISALVPSTDILSMTVQHHVISGRGQL